VSAAERPKLAAVYYEEEPGRNLPRCYIGNGNPVDELILV